MQSRALITSQGLPPAAFFIVIQFPSRYARWNQLSQQCNDERVARNKKLLIKTAIMKTGNFPLSSLSLLYRAFIHKEKSRRLAFFSFIILSPSRFATFLRSIGARLCYFGTYNLDKRHFLSFFLEMVKWISLLYHSPLLCTPYRSYFYVSKHFRSLNNRQNINQHEFILSHTRAIALINYKRFIGLLMELHGAMKLMNLKCTRSRLNWDACAIKPFILSRLEIDGNFLT